jgi:DNA replication protein DnaC
MRFPHSEQTEVRYKCDICKDTEAVFAYIKDGYEYYRWCVCRERKNLDRRLTFANIPKEFSGYTVESFDLGLYQSQDGIEKAEMVKVLCTNYVNDFVNVKEDGKGLYLYSRTKGSGKTRMAASIANDIMTKYNISAKFATTIRILDEIKRTWSDKGEDKSEVSEQKFISDIISVPVLVIDDIGAEKASAWVNEKFYSILNGRMVQKQITIFTSNCEMESLLFDDRIINRIMRMVIPVSFPDESVRAALAKRENKEYYSRLLKG